MAELLPCPFCGDNNARIEGAEFDMFIVSCDPRSGCGACTEMVDDIAAAVAAWNRRAPPIDASRAEDARQMHEVGEMVGHHKVGFGEMPTIHWRAGYWPVVGEKFYSDSERIALIVIADRALATDGDDRG